IIMNLTVNARDAMPQGGTISIETSSVELDADYAAERVGVTPGRYVLLQMTDTGTGMDTATQKRIFEPFFTTKEVGRGTGLGLSTVYGIVQQSGGHIVLDSALGRGTTFRIYLPEASEAAVEPELRRTPVRPPAGSGTVLVVEDDDEVRQVTVRMLRDHGYTVLDTGNGMDAVALATENRAGIDLLLVDVVMPRMSGPTLATELGTILPGLRTLYMSGYAGARAERSPLAPGTRYIEKPFTPSGLVKAVSDLMNA
ncbi:MAG TPA: ATP-binding protein, partial [Polyangiaceae bacterium]|nr:ATP-binding protein [Polyangiaceae bacterium]